MDASIPITLMGKEYHLRYTYPDFALMEKTLEIRYGHFIRPEIFNSLTAQGVYIWTGLKKEVDGKFVHVFPQTKEGLEKAGEMLFEHLHESGDAPKVYDTVLEAFLITGPWKKPSENSETSEGEPKN
jgi:hypothetical protein